MNQVIKAQVQEPNSYDQMHKMATQLIKTNFLPKEVNTAEKAVAIAMTGKELGLGMMESFRSINVIQGKPTLSAQLILALCQKTGQVEDIQIKQTAKSCSVTIKRKGMTPHTATFGEAEANALGLSLKDNYKKQAATMYKWRAISDACRTVFPDATLGIYTPEEIAAGVDVVETQTGVEIVEVHAEQTPAEVKAIEDKAEAEVDSGDILTLGQMVIPFGKYKGMTLLQISGEKTEQGAPKGLKYLEWITLQESKTEQGAKIKAQIAAFLKNFENK